MTTTPARDVTLELEGMTCASCANRIERKLNKLDGVEASVNYALEKATVSFPAGLEVADLVSAVEAAGYHARPEATTEDRRQSAARRVCLGSGAGDRPGRRDPAGDYRRRPSRSIKER